MAGNCIRCAAKYLYDNGFVSGDSVTIETASGVKRLELYTSGGKVTLASVDMGKANFAAKELPTTINADCLLDYPTVIGDKIYNITCVNVGNPHCVVFSDSIESIEIETIGPKFENAPIFPERINTEFVRVVNSNTLKMRVWERGNGETSACGTGACAAVAAACANGKCNKGEDITVKVKGGDLIVNYTDERVILTGDAVLVFDGVTEY